MHIVISVYMNGVFIVEIIRNIDIELHKKYMHNNRKSMGIFIDGVCIQQGYLSGEQIRNWTKRISLMNIDTTHPTILYDIDNHMIEISNNLKELLENNKPAWFVHCRKSEG